MDGEERTESLLTACGVVVGTGETYEHTGVCGKVVWDRALKVGHERPVPDPRGGHQGPGPIRRIQPPQGDDAVSIGARLSLRHPLLVGDLEGPRKV